MAFLRVLLPLGAALLLLLASRSDAAAADPLGELVEVVPVEVSDVEDASAPAPEAASDLAEPLVEDAAPIIEPIEPIAPITEPLVNLVRDELPVPMLLPRVVGDTGGGVTRPATGASPIDVRAGATPIGHSDAVQRPAPAGPPPGDAESPIEHGSTAAAGAASGENRADRLPSPLPFSGLPVLSDGGIAAVAGLSAGLSFAVLMACIGLAMADPIRRTGLYLVPPVPPG